MGPFPFADGVIPGTNGNAPGSVGKWEGPFTQCIAMPAVFTDYPTGGKQI